MKKKSIIILCSVAAICAIGLITNHFIDWPVDLNKADGDIAKAARFSREQVSEKLTNMEELLQTDSAFKDGIVAAQVVMQTRTVQFGTLVDMSNEVAGNIPAFAGVLEEMNANRELVDNVASSLAESADNLNAALEGDKASAEALAKKGNLLSGEKALAAVADFGIAQRIAVLQSCEMARMMDVPSQIGSTIPPKVLESELNTVLNAQQEVLAGRKIGPYHALMMGSASRVMEAFNSAMNNTANNPALNQSQNIGLNQTIGLIIQQTAAVNNSEMLNRRKPNGPPIEK